MSKPGYEFCPDKLIFKKIPSDWKSKIKRLWPYYGLAITLGVLFYFLTEYTYTTPQEKKLKAENKRLHQKFVKLNLDLSHTFHRLKQIEITDDSVYRTMLGMPPLDSNVRKAGFGGSQNNPFLYSDYKETVAKTSERLRSLNSQIKVQEKSFHDLQLKALENQERMKHLPAIMPISNRDLKRTGAGFGLRFHPILKFWRPHEGIDFIAAEGTPVYSTADGKVLKTYRSATFGNVIIINHGFKIQTLYGHLTKFNVKTGETVKRGDSIGTTGSTGLSSGPHLHYEVHINGVEADPVNYFFKDLSAAEYEKIIEIANSHTVSMD